MCKFNLTCKSELTCEGISTSQEPTLTHETGPLTDEEELLTMLTAVANPLRLRVIAELAEGRIHVSELARRLGISRPLLYMHLDKLEKAGLVTGHLELSEDGKAMKYLELVPFEVRVTAEAVVSALAQDEKTRAEADNNDGTTALKTEESSK